MNISELSTAYDEMVGCSITVIATCIEGVFKNFILPYHEETPWREFVAFLEDSRVRLVIKNNKEYFLKVRLFFRKLLPANKVLYIKRRRNKK